MIPYAFPPDAITLHFATSTNATTFTLLDLPPGAVYTILGVSNNSRVSSSINSVLRCGTSDNIVSFNRGTGGFFELLTFRCTDDIQLNLGGGTPPAGFEVSGNIVYTTYDINNSNMATDTPFTSQASWDGGIYFSYNPMQALFGILAITFVFAIFVTWIVKIFRKL